MRLHARLRRFKRDTKGLAAVEFAILLPMMVILLFGSIEIVDLLQANTRTHNAASSLADVTSRDTEISNAEVNALWDALEVLMFPNNVDNMRVCIASVRVVSASVATTEWTECRGLGATIATPQALPAGMMQPGSSVIVTEATLPYASVLGMITDGEITLRHRAHRRSRLVDPIPRVS